MGPTEAAQTPENAMTGLSRDLLQAGNQPQFWPSSMPWGQPAGGRVAESATWSPQIGP